MNITFDQLPGIERFVEHMWWMKVGVFFGVIFLIIIILLFLTGTIQNPFTHFKRRNRRKRIIKQERELLDELKKDEEVQKIISKRFTQTKLISILNEKYPLYSGEVICRTVSDIYHKRNV